MLKRQEAHSLETVNSCMCRKKLNIFIKSVYCMAIDIFYHISDGSLLDFFIFLAKLRQKIV